MRGFLRLLDRFVILGVCLILGVSTGVASIAQGEAEVATGHTGYVSLVRPASAAPELLLPPVEYGLASYRSTALFGVYDRSRPIDEGGNHMVFGWASDRPDPRGDPTLAPTGAFARITDRHGNLWTVYEFTYRALDAPLPPPGIDPVEGPHHAYGVRIGPTRADPDIDAGRYNYALSYRLDRLFPGALPGPDPAPGTSTLTEVLQRGPAPTPDLLQPAGTAANEVHVRTIGTAGPPLELRVLFGSGPAPAILDNADPARPPQRAPRA